jgi:hypothetical protein
MEASIGASSAHRGTATLARSHDGSQIRLRSATREPTSFAGLQGKVVEAPDVAARWMLGLEEETEP